MKILVINPGSTSTKIALYEKEQSKLEKTVRHDSEELEKFSELADQFEYRLGHVKEAVQEGGWELHELDAVVARGGLLKPVPGGTFEINEKMVDDLKKARYGEHASNLGAIMADSLRDELNIPAYIVDPVAVDEFEEVARLSGLKDLERISQSHALNMKAVAREVAENMGKSYFDVNLIVCHLGSGISVAPHKNGKMIDVNNANNEGPFATERAGTLPAYNLVRLCYSGRYSEEEMVKKVIKEGGIYSYMGTKDVSKVEEQAKSGDERAKLVIDAMIYQISKEIGAMATVLEGQVDAIVITGGMANSKYIIGKIQKRVDFIAPVKIVPGERELEALALGAYRVLSGKEQPNIY
ncbi:butyrate kinase [Natranaerobius thermophilus]|uniref:Probable butyrate kinase n=1 Tax=Natranaerobius thermophilus (strain ATCC BAA-1301 / DSM 18059 / JW/NM-WN-LF) TaxID=457570 RepID=B2A8N0_NATTJ|nr:butyrate kinase [Natranaerobius thermophilus]ACB85913.1 butyrate kinase [Natranaerobius thermophilus JW/NM-WN-LF]